jgi:hypothetical protein
MTLTEVVERICADGAANDEAARAQLIAALADGVLSLKWDDSNPDSHRYTDRGSVERDQPHGKGSYWRENAKFRWESGEILNDWCSYRHNEWRKLLIRKISVNKFWPQPKKRGGRPPILSWELVEQKVIKLMDHHGDFSAADPEWNSQAKLEEKIGEFCEDKFGVRPAESTIRDHAVKFYKTWQDSKAGN